MIVRIKKICQVGVFNDFRTGGSLTIGGKQMTVIFGLNRRGKSTLSAIFQSIGEDEPKYILDRVTIPPKPSATQKIETSYIQGSGGETNLNFTSGHWVDNKLKGKVLVYDQDFVHRNVITGSAITRDNKESFTDFVLGSEGVKLSNTIESDNKELRAKKGSLRNFRPKHVKFVAADKEAEEFARLKITEKKADIVKSLEGDEKRLARLENLEKFKAQKTPELKLDDLTKSVNDVIEESKSVLEKTYAEVSDEAWETLKQHIEKNCDGEQSVSWLKKGLKINKSKHCPYCGQDLASAKNLITAYQSIFDVKFDEYETELNGEIISLKAKIRTLLATSLSSQMTNFIIASEPFNPYIPELEERITEARKQLDLLITHETEYKSALAI
jgi:wobble nucleotide-excising tRNase